MFTFAVSIALTLIAPPPAAAIDPGRITLWVGDKCERFSPDGKNAVKLTVPADSSPRIRISSDGKSAVYAHRLRGHPVSYGKVTVTGLIEDAPTIALDGYIARVSSIFTEGSKVYFTGNKWDEATKSAEKGQ